MTRRDSFVDGEGQGGPSLARYEEELVTGTRPIEDATIRLRKTVETQRVDESVPYQVQYGEVERVPPNELDSGEVETLEDGSLSIPVLEEQVVVTRRTVVRERIIVRRRSQTEVQRVTMDLKREHVEVEGPEDLIEVRAGCRAGGLQPASHRALPGNEPEAPVVLGGTPAQTRQYVQPNRPSGLTGPAARACIRRARPLCRPARAASLRLLRRGRGG